MNEQKNLSNEIRTMITIIGTIHQGTKFFSTLDLFNKLNEIKPEIIFEESPKDLYTHPKNISLPFGKELGSMEKTAIKWYYDKHKIKTIPVDLPKRDEIFKNTIGKQNFENVYFFFKNILYTNKLNKTEHKKLNRYMLLIEKQQRLALSGNMKDINGKKMERIILEKRNLMKTICIEILNKYLNDKKYMNTFQNYITWMEKREDYMTKEILKYLTTYKRLVFIVGVDHKPFIQTHPNKKA